MNIRQSEMRSRFCRWTNLRTLAVAAFGLILAPVVNAAMGNPYLKSDESWISVAGTVDSVKADSFTLDFGEGTVIVEMDDGDRDADAYKLLRGDEVTVTGRVDRDFFEKTTIEAASVYVKNIGTTFFASSVDDEDWNKITYSAIDLMPVESTSIIGEVTEINGKEFTVSSGLSAMRVDVSSMPYNPLDDEGYQKIDVGDVVKVTGTIDSRIFDGREIAANLIVELHGS